MRRYKAFLNYRYRYQVLAVVIFVIAFGGGLIYRSHSPANYNQVNAAQIPDKCANLDVRKQNSYSCYKKELTDIINSQSPEQATSFLKQQYVTSAYVKADCHQLMHVVGRASYAKYNSLAEAFAHGDQFCWSGFYHGIMEQISVEKGIGYITQNADSICQPIAAQYGQGSFYDYNCVHGLGHGFMEVLDNNLFTALSSCDSMSLDWNRSSCYGGVFMQNIMNIQGPEAEDAASYPYLKAAQPMYPCTAVDYQYKEQCYLMQTSYALQVEKYDFSKVFGLCAGIETQYRDTCYQSTGRDASGQSISNVQKTKATCLLGQDLNAQTNCTIGAAKDFVSYFHSDKQGYALCAAMPKDISGTCSDTVRQYYSTF